MVSRLFDSQQKANKVKMDKIDNLKLLNIDTSLYKTRLSKKFENRKAYQPANPKIVVSFIPGVVLDILVKEGVQVKKGEELIILDAMKMQNRLKSSIGGIIKKISVTKGDKVSKGTVLLELE
jgi:biotin carboxyl carrier protein